MTLPHIGFGGRWRHFPRRTGKASTEATLATITLTERDSAASTGISRPFGMAFAKGAVPSGYRVQARLAGGADLPTDTLMSNTWSDGSLHKCGVVVHASSLSAGGSTSIELYATAGAEPASSFNPWTFIAGLGDYPRVRVTNRTGSAGTGGSRNSVNYSDSTRPDLTFDMQAAAAVSAQRKIWEDRARYVEAEFWQKVSGEEHLVIEWHCRFYLDSDGSTVRAWEYLPVLTQPYGPEDPHGTQQSKERYTYDVILEWGSGASWSTTESHSSLAHAYYNSFAILSLGGTDATYARWHWVDEDSSTAEPTTDVVYAEATVQPLIARGFFPLNDLATSWPAQTAETYTPLGTNGHRAAIDGTGGYVGRGYVPTFDAYAAVEQRARDFRNTRVAAQAGLSVPWRWYDHRSTYETLRIIPQPFTVLGAQSYTGLGTETEHGKQTGWTLTAAAVNGGTGAFTYTTKDDSHHVNYAGMAAFLYADRSLLKAAVAAFEQSMTMGHLNTFGHDSRLEGVTSHKVHLYYRQERGPAWSTNQMLWAARLLPGDDPQTEYLLNAVDNHDRYWSAVTTAFSTELAARGGFAWGTGNVISPWMQHFAPICVYPQLEFVEDKIADMDGLRAWAEACAWLAGRIADNGKWGALDRYRGISSLNSAHDAWEDVDEVLWLNTFAYTGDTFTDSQSIVANDDVMYAATHDENNNAASLPTGLALATRYYVVEYSGGSFKLSATQGGSAISVTGSGNFHAGVSLSSHEITVAGTGNLLMPAADDYAPIAGAALEAAFAFDPAGRVTAAHVNGSRTFLAPVDDDPRWDYDAENVRSLS